MKQVVLRYLLEMGHALDRVTTADEAERTIQQWSQGTLKGVKYGHDIVLGRFWSVDMARVQSMLTEDFDLQAHKKQAVGGLGSGRN